MEELMKLREQGFVIFTKEGNIYTLILNFNDLTQFILECGWESVEEFEKEVGWSREKVIGTAVCYSGSKLWFIEDEKWFKRR